MMDWKILEGGYRYRDNYHNDTRKELVIYLKFNLNLFPSYMSLFSFSISYLTLPSPPSISSVTYAREANENTRMHCFHSLQRGTIEG
jgi:hypothetical protein